MDAGRDICLLSANELSRLFHRRELSPVEVADAVIHQIEALNPSLAAFTALDHRRVRAEAERAEAALMRSESVGPLHGVPISIKDLIFTKDYPTSGGSRVYAGFVPDEDDVVVERVVRAGAIILGKTSTPDFGFGPSFKPVRGVARNPWDLDRTPGGSSSGSAAAVAAGMGPVSVGSDGGGSIRVPASFCGVYGFNPSFGRVPLYPGARDTRYPGFSGWESVERIGPLTRTVADAALVLDVIVGPDPRDRHSLPWAGAAFLDDLEVDLTNLRVAVTADWGGTTPVDAEVADCVEQAARQFSAMGAVVDVASPEFRDPAGIFDTIVALDSDLSAMADLVDRYTHDMVPPRLVALVGKERSFRDASRAVAARKDLYNSFWRFFADYDLLLTPTAPVAAFPVDLEEPAEIGGAPTASAMPLAQFTAPISLAGNPAASVPCGWTPNGLPVGLQIVGNHLDDRLVLQASRAFELAQPWAHRRPPLVGGAVAHEGQRRGRTDER